MWVRGCIVSPLMPRRTFIGGDNRGLALKETPVDGKLTATDIRNSAYVYDPTGTQFAGRYDKIHLVPFSEIMPMRQTIPILHRALLRLAAYSAEYPLVPGPADALTVFTLRPFVNDTLAAEPSWKFVTPICSEDFDAPLIASIPGTPGYTRPARARGPDRTLARNPGQRRRARSGR